MGRVRAAALLLAMLATSTACGSADRAASTSVAKVQRRPPPRQSAESWVHVTVVDGDRSRRVPGAFVRIGHKARITDRRGIARIKIPRRTSLVVRVKRRGYTGAKQRF